MPRKDRIDDLRSDAVLIALYAPEKRLVLTQLSEQVLPHLVLDGSVSIRRGFPKDSTIILLTWMDASSFTMPLRQL